MAQTDPPSDAQTRRPLSSRVIALALEAMALGMLAAAGGALVVYETRKEIAADVAEDWLRRQGIEADIQVQRLDATGFSGRIRLGPKNDPDLIADRIDVEYDLIAPWAGGPFALTPRRIRVVRPRAKLAFDGEKLKFSSLDPLIEDLLKRPKTDQPAPDIFIEDGELRLSTPYGLIRANGAEAALSKGRLMRLDARLAAANLKSGEASARLTGGEVHVRGDGERLAGVLSLAVARAGQGDVVLREADLRARLDDVRYTLAGGAMKVTARGRLRAEAAAFEAGATRVAAPALDFTFNTLQATSGPALSGGFDAIGDISAKTIASEESTARDVLAQARLTDATWSAGEGGIRLSAPLTLTATAQGLPLRLGETPLALSGLKADFAGRVDTAAPTPISGRVNLSANGGFSAADAAKIAAEAPVLGQEEAYRLALQRALTRFRLTAPDLTLALGGKGPDVRLNGPVTLTSASGVTVAVTPKGLRFTDGVSGAASLAVSGDGLPTIALDASQISVRGETVSAQIALTTALDFGPAKNAALSIKGLARSDRAGFSFTSAACASLKAERLDFGETQIEQPSAQICPTDGAPLVVARQGGWRLAGRLQEGRAAIPVLMITADGAAGGFVLAGDDKGAMTAEVSLADIGVTDTAKPLRFNPLRAGGAARLNGDIWRGEFQARTEAGHAVAKIGLEHDQRSGAGHADIDASQLRFTPAGLQPADITPQAVVLDHAQGPASFVGRMTWSAEAPANGTGRMVTPGLDFISPVGAVAQLKADVTFTSLAPLVTADDQVVTANLIEAFAKLSDIKLVFDLAGEVLHIDAGALSAVGGRLELEPIALPLTKETTVRGAIVVDKVNLGDVIALTSYADRIKADLVVNGRLPFEVGPGGFKFERGTLATIRPGRLAINRSVLSGVETGAAEVQAPDLGGETVGTPDVNAVQDMAFQAMENLAVDSLSATVESLPNGRLSVIFAIKGQHSPAVGEKATLSVADLISRKAFNKRIPLPKGTPIDLTLDTSLNFDEVLEGMRSSIETFREMRLDARSDAVQP